MFQKLIPRIDYGDQQLSLQYVCEENPLNVTIQIQKKTLRQYLCMVQ